MNIKRLYNKLRYKVLKPIVYSIELLNGPLHMKLVTSLLKSSGVQVQGPLAYVHKTVHFDDFDKIILGRGTVLSTDVYLLSHDWSRHIAYNVLKEDISYLDQGTKLQEAIRRDSPVLKRIEIGNNVFIGARSFILPGTIIEDNCIIGAGSVLRGRIPSGSVVCGNPAKIVGSVEEFGKKWCNL